MVFSDVVKHPKVLAAVAREFPETLSAIELEPEAAAEALEELSMASGTAGLEIGILEIYAKYRQFEYANLPQRPPSYEATQLLTSEQAQEHSVVPFSITSDKEVRVAISDPGDREKTKWITGLLNNRKLTRISFFYEPAANIKRFIDQHYAKLNPDETAAVAFSRDGVDRTDLAQDADSGISRMLFEILQIGIQRRATDIHIDPGSAQQRANATVRFRVDGVLTHHQNIDYDDYEKVVNRIMTHSNMKIDERSMHQDGSTSVSVGQVRRDLRVSVMQVVGGKMVKIRVMANEQELTTLDELGFSDANRRRFDHLTKNRALGMVLLTGPTGSGKSTTAHALLRARASTGRENIITVEDPVEKKLPSVNQVSVDEKHGRTFAHSLESILRSDPDIVYIGEIRDNQSAKIAIDMAYTGHFVISTLHTNSAVDSLMRMKQGFDLDPYVVSDSLAGAVAQRLIPRLCQHCKVEAPAKVARQAAEQAKLRFNLESDLATDTFFRPHKNGCRHCDHRGTRGRIGIHEIFLVDRRVKELIRDVHNPELEILDYVTSEDGPMGAMITLREDAWLRAREGVISPLEVLNKHEF